MLPLRTEGGKGDCRKVPNAQDGREVTVESKGVAKSVFLGGLGKCVSWKMPVAVLVNTLVLQRKMRWKMKNRQLL